MAYELIKKDEDFSVAPELKAEAEKILAAAERELLK